MRLLLPEKWRSAVDTLNCSATRRVIAGCVIAATLGLGSAAPADADTIDQMVQNSGALESPFWRYLYEHGYGYLDAKRVNDDGNIACANRKAGVPPSQVIPLLESRSYSKEEAQGIVLAEEAASKSQAFPVC
jgi:hypothetical protein